MVQPNASPWVQTYDYDGFGRLMTVASPAGTFGYQYASIYPNYTKGQNAASDLISQLTYPTGASSTRSYDNLAEVDNLTLTVGSLTLDEHSYNYNQGFQAQTRPSLRIILSTMLMIISAN